MHKLHFFMSIIEVQNLSNGLKAWNNKDYSKLVNHNLGIVIRNSR